VFLHRLPFSGRNWPMNVAYATKEIIVFCRDGRTTIAAGHDQLEIMRAGQGVNKCTSIQGLNTVLGVRKEETKHKHIHVMNARSFRRSDLEN